MFEKESASSMTSKVPTPGRSRIMPLRAFRPRMFYTGWLIAKQQGTTTNVSGAFGGVCSLMKDQCHQPRADKSTRRQQQVTAITPVHGCRNTERCDETRKQFTRSLFAPNHFCCICFIHARHIITLCAKTISGHVGFFFQKKRTRSIGLLKPKFSHAKRSKRHENTGCEQR